MDRIVSISSDNLALTGQDTRSFIYVFIAGVIFYALIPSMFELSLSTGIGFIITCVLAFKKRVIFKDPIFVMSVAFGYILINVAFNQVFPLVYKNAVQGSIVTAFIILFVFLAIYLKGKECNLIELRQNRHLESMKLGGIIYKGKSKHQIIKKIIWLLWAIVPNNNPLIF